LINITYRDKLKKNKAKYYREVMSDNWRKNKRIKERNALDAEAIGKKAESNPGKNRNV
jgi:hypothetical protein